MFRESTEVLRDIVDQLEFERSGQRRLCASVWGRLLERAMVEAEAHLDEPLTAVQRATVRATIVSRLERASSNPLQMLLDELETSYPDGLGASGTDLLIQLLTDPVLLGKPEAKKLGEFVNENWDEIDQEQRARLLPALRVARSRFDER